MPHSRVHIFAQPARTPAIMAERATDSQKNPSSQDIIIRQPQHSLRSGDTGECDRTEPN